MSEKLRGVVKFYSKSRAGGRAAFGFVGRDAGEDVYFNAAILARNGVTDLYAGYTVEFSIRENSRGKPEIDQIELIEVVG
jgi:cold shock CspA family protein